VIRCSGLERFVVSSHSCPFPGGFLRSSGWWASLAIDGSSGYLVAGPELLVLDLAGGGAPVVLGSLAIAGEQLTGVSAGGGPAVVTGFDNALYTIDVANPASPQMQAFLAGGPAFDVRLVGDRAVVAAGAAGIRVADVSDPFAPVFEAGLDTADEAVSIALDGDVVCMATPAAQHWLARCDTCACVDSWPTIAANSLAVVKGPDTFSWTIAGGSGTSNLHETDVKTALPSLHADMGTLVGSTTGTSLVESGQPGVGQVRHYRVFGASVCTGESRP
jgi:hypothetical protein